MQKKILLLLGLSVFLGLQLQAPSGRKRSGERTTRKGKTGNATVKHCCNSVEEWCAWACGCPYGNGPLLKALQDDDSNKFVEMIERNYRKNGNQPTEFMPSFAFAALAGKMKPKNRKKVLKALFDCGVKGDAKYGSNLDVKFFRNEPDERSLFRYALRQDVSVGELKMLRGDRGDAEAPETEGLLKQNVLTVTDEDINCAIYSNQSPKVVEYLCNERPGVVRDSNLVADLFRSFKFGQPPEESAIRLLENLNTLLKLGANPNAKISEGGTSVLHYAAQYLTPSTVTALLGARADVNTPNKKGVYPIHVAQNPETLKELCAAGANIDEETKRGDTELLRRLRVGEDLEFVKVLLELNANVNTQNDNGETAALLAVRNKNLKILDLVLSYQPKLDQLGQKNPLFCAAEMEGDERFEFLTRLVNANADLDALNAEGEGLLHQAARKGDDALREFLFDQPGLNISLLNGENRTALEVAVFAGKAMAPYLLDRIVQGKGDKGIVQVRPVDITDKGIVDLLAQFAKENRFKDARALTTTFLRDINLNSCGTGTVTPLMAATQVHEDPVAANLLGLGGKDGNDCTQVAKLLLAMKADPCLSFGGKSPISIARQDPAKMKLLALLEKYSAENKGSGSADCAAAGQSTSGGESKKDK